MGIIKKARSKINYMENQINEISIDIASLEKQTTIFRNESSRQIEVTQRKANEMIWAQVFNNSITCSEWLKNTSFSPGRWAAGYPFLFILYQVLSGTRPEKILELGLGQTTKMITQYAGYYKYDHDVVEHDNSWIEHCKNIFELHEKTSVHLLDLEQRPYLNDQNVTTYKGFAEKFADKQYGLILIDGPFGGHEDIYARVDIMDILPNCLEKSFVILIDDYNRVCEKQMAELLKQAMFQHNIAFESGVYSGIKDTLIITSLNNHFFCSM